MFVADRVDSTFIPNPDDEATANHVAITGYVGREPQLRYTAEGAIIASLSLATHRWHGEDGVLVRTTDWHRIVAFDEVAEIARRLRSGELVLASGRLHTRTWRDRLGTHHQTTEIIATDLRRVRRRPSQLELDINEPRTPQAA